MAVPNVLYPLCSFVFITLLKLIMLSGSNTVFVQEVLVSTNHVSTH